MVYDIYEKVKLLPYVRQAFSWINMAESLNFLRIFIAKSPLLNLKNNLPCD
jgi:hypothetical protein